MPNARAAKMLNRRRYRLSVALAAVICAAAIGACGSSGTPSGGAKRIGGSFISYSQCMRSHGVPNFPDPSPSGGIQINSSSGVNPRSPAFQSAQQVCQKQLPGGGPPPTSASQVAAMVTISHCMRAHGLASFPDPTRSPPSSPQGNVIGINGAFFDLGSGLNPASPAFRHAASGCGLGGPH